MVKVTEQKALEDKMDMETPNPDMEENKSNKDKDVWNWSEY